MGVRDVALGCFPFQVNTGAGFSTFVFDAATDELHWPFVAEETDTITDVGFFINTKSGTPPTHTVGIQTFDSATGYGTGTYLNAGNAKASFTLGAAGAFQEVTLGATASLSRGVVYVLVLKPDSAPGANTSTFNARMSNSISFGPRAVSINGGVPAYSRDIPIYALKSASRYYGVPITAVSDDTTQGIYGNRFTVPQGVKRILGARCIVRVNGAGTSFAIELYSGNATTDTTVTETVTVERTYGSAPDAITLQDFYFDNPVDVTPGALYRLAFNITSASNNHRISKFTVPSNSHLAAFPLGTSFAYSTRTTGNWTDTNTVMSGIFPLVELIDSAGSAGQTGSKFNRNFN